MPTIPTRAITRALNYALESSEGSPEKLLAIRLDYKRLLEQDFSEVAIVATLSRCAVRVVQMEKLKRMAEDATTDPAVMFDYGMRLRDAIMAQEVGPLE